MVGELLANTPVSQSSGLTLTFPGWEIVPAQCAQWQRFVAALKDSTVKACEGHIWLSGSYDPKDVSGVGRLWGWVPAGCI